MPLALTGSLMAVQFRYPAELPLVLNPANGGKHLSKVSMLEVSSLNAVIFSRAHLVIGYIEDVR